MIADPVIFDIHKFTRSFDQVKRAGLSFKQITWSEFAAFDGRKVVGRIALQGRPGSDKARWGWYLEIGGHFDSGKCRSQLNARLQLQEAFKRAKSRQEHNVIKL